MHESFLKRKIPVVAYFAIFCLGIGTNAIKMTFPKTWNTMISWGTPFPKVGNINFRNKMQRLMVVT